MRQAYDYWQDQPGSFTVLCVRELRRVIRPGAASHGAPEPTARGSPRTTLLYDDDWHPWCAAVREQTLHCWRSLKVRSCSAPLPFSTRRRSGPTLKIYESGPRQIRGLRCTSTAEHNLPPHRRRCAYYGCEVLVQRRAASGHRSVQPFHYSAHCPVHVNRTLLSGAMRGRRATGARPPKRTLAATGTRGLINRGACEGVRWRYFARGPQGFSVAPHWRRPLATPSRVGRLSWA